MNGDPNIILGHSGQTPVAVSAGGQQIPVSQIIAAQSGQNHSEWNIIKTIKMSFGYKLWELQTRLLHWLDIWSMKKWLKI